MKTFLVPGDDMLAWFLLLHDYWFTDPQNSLYGLREPAKQALAEYLRTGRLPRPHDQDHRYVYLQTKLDEWLSHYPDTEEAGRRVGEI